MRAPIIKIARWIRDEHPGATTRDIQAKFNLTNKEAASTMATIKQMHRYVTRWEPGVGWPAAKNYIPGKLYVDEINDPIYVKDPWGGVTGTRAVMKGDAGDTVYFKSVYEAENIGGFCSMGIYQCLWGQQKTHGGYIWTADNQDTRKTT